MLKRMKIKNYRSIKNELEITFIPNDNPYLKTNFYNDILKGAVFFGGNSSGKSSILQAISLLKLLLSNEGNNCIKDCACVFSLSSLMEFEYEFVFDKTKIIYDFSYANDGLLISEKFYLDDHLIFDRDDIKSLEKVFLHKPTINYLSFVNNEIRDLDIQPKLQKLLDFINNSIIVGNNKSNNEAYPRINNLNGEEYLKRYLNNGGLIRINAFFNQYHFPFKLVNEGNTLSFQKKGIAKLIPFELESLGMRTLCIILPAILNLKEHNGVLIIDEFSSAFHNRLEELLVRDIMRSYQGSQFFFVSHSTNLMNNSLLRPDQLFIIDFDEEGSKVTSVAAFSPRPSQNIEKMYLAGVFGGIPFYEEDEIQ